MAEIGVFVMILPRGVTGFRGSRTAAIVGVDAKKFHSTCHAVARMLGGRASLHDAHLWPRTSSFDACLLRLPQYHLAVLINRHSPLLAFAETPTPGSFSLQFIDAPEVADSFRRLCDYQILNACSLNEPVSEICVNELAECELMQIRYWKPERVGDVVFNFWD
jgi:hypothetical protein